jgi:uncharacterized protein YegP (UPF0339 family)
MICIFKDYLSDDFIISFEISRNKPLTMFSYNSKSPLGLVVSYFNNSMCAPKVEVCRDSKNEWRWHVKDSNGNTFGESSGSYKTLLDCEENIKHVVKALKSYFERSI